MKSTTVAGHYIALLWATAVFLLLLTLFSFMLPDLTAHWFLSEGGPVETLSAAGYIVCLVTLVREWEYPQLLDHYYFPSTILAGCARELDFHTLFTSRSISTLRFYTSGDVPMAEKVVVVAVLVFLAWCGIAMIRRHAGDFFTGLRKGNVTALAIAAAIISGGLSKSFDGLGRKLADFGIELGLGGIKAALAIEEVLELGIPMFLMIAIFAYFPKVTAARVQRNAS
ncbi:hypothetical protein [Aquamicrobium sp. LC103]|uniref:hypothetical protein n=1 Tax=Aquamicrobium sp. LC103 TaxID=1120658 RepID=UPI00063EC49F|nr:hypothetical protein [Aquamicrobium sp. LC103]TKT76901.1 hypothetical protein XW59_015695 [Aquamicrobium sp. LC103]